MLLDKEVGQRLNGSRRIFVKQLGEGEADQTVPRKLTKTFLGIFPRQAFRSLAKKEQIE